MALLPLQRMARYGFLLPLAGIEPVNLGFNANHLTTEDV
jgi:hypothetical protein